MTPGKFLRLVWPDKGFYCLAHPFKPEGSSVTVYTHRVFDNISAAVTHVHTMEHSADTYFAVLSLEQEKRWDPNKKDYKTGQPGAYAVRVQENMLAAKALFFDLDVGSDAGKYPTQAEALKALIAYCQTAKLPMPTLVSSGGGVHVYWHFAETVGVEEWRDLAWNSRQLADALKLKVDPTRTIDSTSVLRVPGTFNWKDRTNPRRVQVLQEGAITPIAVLRQLIHDALIRAGTTPDASAPARRIAAPANALGVASNLDLNSFGPPPTLKELGDTCGQVREILRSQTDPSHPHHGPLDNTAWYRGMIATLHHVEDGDNWCRKLTALHPRSVADIEAKLVQASNFPPAKCETLQQFMPWRDAPCQTCRFRDKVANPFMAARKSVPAPPPSLSLSAGSSAPPAPPPLPGGAFAGSVVGAAPAPTAPSLSVVAAMLPNPPKPYERLKAGGVAVTHTDKDGNETTRVIYENDLFPLKRLANGDDRKEQQLWRVAIPRVGYRDFTIDADTLYDSRKFCVAIAHNGVYPHKADIPALQDYMIAYISQLQKVDDAAEQVGHLGWADEYRRFILPDKTLHEDGTVSTTALSLPAERAAQHITKRGDLTSQIALLHFYDHDDYIPNQTVILGSLASAIFYATGHHGVVVNCSGDAGASKSTTLYTAAGLWGDPQMWPINGTNRGATANARTQRIVTNANLPTCVDEITHLPAKEAIDLVMNITQPGHRLRLDVTGAERQTASNYKSAIMIATANSSLHGLLSTDNAAGTAGSMRVFEMRFQIQRVHTKAEADEFLRQINQHHGHVGEVFVNFVVRHRAAVEKRVQQVMREVDEAGQITSAERFWSAYVATVVVAGEIARALGLTAYDPNKIRTWLVTRQIPHMRGVVREEYRDSTAVLTDYIAEKNGNILVLNRTGSTGVNTNGNHAAGLTYAENKPGGALLGHYDRAAGVLYLLKQGFKEHCQRIGASSVKILEELCQPRPTAAGQPMRIVVDRQVRRTLGAGTEYAKGQSWCFAVDMNHPEISGQTPLAPVASGIATTAPPAAHLSVVK